MAADICDLHTESCIIATLIHHPEFSFSSENLLPTHFYLVENQCIYTAICKLAEREITVIDPYNILEILNDESSRRLSENITVESLFDLIDHSNSMARNSLEEYKLCVDRVINLAFRRDTLRQLKECESLCYEGSDDIEQEIYSKIDNIMTEYSSVEMIPQYKDVVDKCWDEIISRQGDGYAGIPFKFPTLNEYATIEQGELFIFAAEAKQGKSMMLLNCAVDLLRQDKSVLYLDSELNTRMFTARLLAHLSGIEYKRLTAGSYTEEERRRILEAKEWMKTRKFTHLYIPLFDPQSVYTAAKKIAHTQGLDVLIVDYFKGSSEGDAYASYAELGRFVDLVKNRICGDMGVCGIGAAQATAAGKVADSAKIGRNASTIAILLDKTPEEIAADGEECGNKKLRVILNRNGMQHASNEYISLSFNGNLISYEEAKQAPPSLPY